MLASISSNAGYQRFDVEMPPSELEAIKASKEASLKFKKGVFLEDDGTALPLGNSDYTMEFWIRFDGERSCFVGFGIGRFGFHVSALTKPMKPRSTPR